MAEKATTTVIYYIDDEETPYSIEVPISPRNMTLAHFKKLFHCSNYKFFSESAHVRLGPVKKEIIEDNVNLPSVNGEVVLWAKKLKHLETTSSETTSSETTSPSSHHHTNTFIPVFLHLAKEAFFVDKSLLIPVLSKYIFGDELNVEDIWNYRDPVLIVGPRLFGKTTNLSLFQGFLDASIPRDVVSTLKVNQISAAMDLYGRFCTVYICFAWCADAITSAEECRHACAHILHTTFSKHKYLLSNMKPTNMETFKDWIDAKKYLEKTPDEISDGLSFLVDCLLFYHDYKKPVVLFVDEFGTLFYRALYNVENENTLKSVVNVYSNMLGRVVKLQKKCHAVFTGVAACTSHVMSSLDNIRVKSFLNDEELATFYGMTESEFEKVLSHKDIPETIKRQKEEAKLYYNGYNNVGNSIYNIFSVVKFIKAGKIDGYWRQSGIAAGLTSAIKYRKWRKNITKLLSGADIEMKLHDNINTVDFHLIRDECFEIDNFEFLMNFLLQQGYLTVAKNTENRKATVRIPNVEIREELHHQLSSMFNQNYTFDQNEIKKCQRILMNIDIENADQCKQTMRDFKASLNKLTIGFEKEQVINEAYWIEALLFHLFVEQFTVQHQVETAKKKKMNTARILDTFIRTGSHCIVFEESVKDSALESIRELVSKKYHLESEATKLPFVLIGLSVKDGNNGSYWIGLAYLRNTYFIGDVELLEEEDV
ncbi:uncharacterized protein LOC135849083 [Planococcus citri]|uniref:uncharacterized protein LOC135849083 n=1 Tax=Planococcus citri TaxID=170843 RepID=UPI0031F888D7